MALQNHQERNCLSLESSAFGTRSGTIEGNVIDKEAKAILETCPETKFILHEIERHLLERYPSVFNGTLNEVKSFPQLFDYGVDTKKGRKAFAMQHGNEKDIKARINELLGAKAMEDVKERTHLEEILMEKRPLSCEDRVNQRFLAFFKNEPGLFLHGFKPKEYLQRFKELAQEKRRTMSTLRLLDIELCVLELLGIKEQEIEDWVNDKIDSIKIKSNEKTGKTSTNGIPGVFIWDVFQLDLPKSFPKERKNQYNQLKSWFPKFKKSTKSGKQADLLDINGQKIEAIYSLNEVRSRLMKSEFDFVTSFDDEYDLFFVHPNEKLILAGEVKQAMQNDPNTISANDKQAKSASRQLKKSEKFMKKTFGHLLDQGWRYVKIAILYDNNGTYITNKCPRCEPFILVNGTEEEEEKQMNHLWKAITGKEYAGPPKQSSISGMRDFQYLFARLIGFSGLSFIVQKVGNYHELMGTKSHDIFDEGITAGWTRASPLSFGTDNSDIRFGDVVGRPSDIYRIIFWNPSQLHLLAGDHQFVIFCDDYGAGKSLLLKEGSIREANAIENRNNDSATDHESKAPGKEPSKFGELVTCDDKKPNAFFICLVATNLRGLPEKEHYLYDVATEMELQGFKVKFLSAKDIKMFYQRHHPNFDEEKIDIYEMSRFFIEMHKGSSFFLDEVPIITYGLDIYELASVDRLETFLLDSQQQICKGKLWVALQVNQLSDQSRTKDDFEIKFKEMMSKLERSYVISKLNINMRNSEKVNKVTHCLHRDSESSYQVSEIVDKLPAPTSLSAQHEPVMIPVHQQDFASSFQSMLNEKEFNPRKKTLILHSSSFKGKDLSSLLLKNFTEIQPESILLHDSHRNNASKKDLQDFLKQPEIKIGIFKARYVTGMEGSNVIYFHDAGDKKDTSIRCTMTRAVSQLCIIVRFNDRNTYPTKCSNIKVNNSFIKCKKTLEKKDKYYRCSSCKTNQICVGCLLGCHHGCQTNYEAMVTFSFEIVKCNCIKSNCKS